MPPRIKPRGARVSRIAELARRRTRSTRGHPDRGPPIGTTGRAEGRRGARLQNSARHQTGAAVERVGETPGKAASTTNQLGGRLWTGEGEAAAIGARRNATSNSEFHRSLCRSWFLWWRRCALSRSIPPSVFALSLPLPRSPSRHVTERMPKRFDAAGCQPANSFAYK